MRFKVLLSDEAVRDIEEIYRYIAENDAVVKAERVLAGLEAACQRLAAFPERAMCPKNSAP